MAQQLKDVIVAIPTKRVGHFETWLLSRGYSFDQAVDTADGGRVFYALAGLPPDARAEISQIDGEVVSEWKPGDKLRRTVAKS